MNKYELTYKQTPEERYGSTMNADVGDLIDSYPGVRTITESGGCPMTPERNAMVADNSFTVEGSDLTVRSLVVAIQRKIDRPVTLEMQ